MSGPINAMSRAWMQWLLKRSQLNLRSCRRYIHLLRGRRPARLYAAQTITRNRCDDPKPPTTELASFPAKFESRRNYSYNYKDVMSLLRSKSMRYNFFFSSNFKAEYHQSSAEVWPRFRSTFVLRREIWKRAEAILMEEEENTYWVYCFTVCKSTHPCFWYCVSNGNHFFYIKLCVEIGPHCPQVELLG